MGKLTEEQASEQLLRAGARFEATHRKFVEACDEEPRDESKIMQLRQEAGCAYEDWRAASFRVAFCRTPR